MSTTPATLRTVVPAHSGRAHNNLTPSRPPTMFYVLSSSYGSTTSAPSCPNLYAGLNIPSSSLTSKPSGRRLYGGKKSALWTPLRCSSRGP